MTIKSFFSKIGDGIKSVGHSIGQFASSGYNDIKNVVTGIGHGISTQVANAQHTVNNIIQSGTGIVNNLIKTGGNLIQHTEDVVKSTISTPLLIIAAAIGGLIFFKGDTVATTAINRI